MSRAQRISNLVAVILPFAAFVAAVALLWNSVVGWTDLALFGVFYVLTGLGVTIGFHRYLTHRSFATSRPVGYALALLGSLAVQGSVITWVADHRKHHAHTDQEGDPHSPHVGHGSGLRGLWHAHVGWLWDRQAGHAVAEKYARDLVEDRGMRALDRAFFPLVGVTLLVPFALGWVLTGEIEGALTGLLWGGLVRVFFLHHVTWSINSVCHFFGRRRFATDDRSTNVAWLSIVSFGESWHHNHHTFPRSAFHGLRRFEVDPSAIVIWSLEKLGLIWDVVRITPERQLARTAR